MQLDTAQRLDGDGTTAGDSSVATRTMLAGLILRHLNGPAEYATAVPGLSFFRCDGRNAPASVVYEPSLSFIVQGRKRVVLGAEEYEYDETRFLLTSIDLPTISQVLDGSETHPYLSILLKLDLAVAQQVCAEIDMHGLQAETHGPGMAVGPVTAGLLEAVTRLAMLSDQATDIPVLGGLMMREILYRLLMSPAGCRLRQTAVLGTQSNRIARVTAWLREHYAQPFRIEELAEIAAMGVSTLHHHFRAATNMSPLQYQKQLRLHEARRLLLTELLDASTVALRVGYESATQFSREYRRLFGNPPRRDIAALRGEPTSNRS